MAYASVILRTVWVQRTVRGLSPDSDISLTHRWMDSWSIFAIGQVPKCGWIRNLQLSSYPRRTLALRSGREAMLFERIRAVANTPVSEVIHVARVAKRGRQAGVSVIANAADVTVQNLD